MDAWPPPGTPAHGAGDGGAGAPGPRPRPRPSRGSASSRPSSRGSGVAGSSGVSGPSGSSREPSSRRRPADRSARRARRLRVIAVVMSAAVLVVATVGYAGYRHYLAKVTSVEVFTGQSERPAELDDGATTFLLVGSDSRFGLSKKDRRKYRTGSDEGERSDTLMLVHLSEQRDQAMLLSLPRDSWVTVPAHTGADGAVVPAHSSKLNGAYSLGGPSLTVETVEQATGVRIDHYLEVNFLGFARMVDALGGVDVCLPAPVDDHKSGLQLPAGTSRVDGTQGLAYVRARKTLGDGSDLGRIERQQQFLAAMLREATNPGVLLNPLRLNSFLAAATESLRTDPDLSGGELRSLAMKLRSIDPGQVAFTTVPIADKNHRTPDGQSAVLWDAPKAEELFAAIRADEEVPEKGGKGKGKGGKSRPLTVPPEDVAVQVVNGTRISGLAGGAARDLRAVGFRVPGALGNADTPDTTRTEIRYAPGNAEAARTLAAAVDGAALVEDSTMGDGVQLRLGPDYTGATAVRMPGQPAPTKAPASEPSPTVPAKTAAQSACD